MPRIVEQSEPFRAFVNLGTGACPCECRYCYVPHGRSVPYSWQDIESGMKAFMDSRYFAAGGTGTIVTFGGHTDLFRSVTLTQSLIRALAVICEHGNPVQISTKQWVSEDLTQRIESNQRYVGQISMFVSCASITGASTVERAADPPVKRWKTFASQKTAGLSRALLIKPWLGSITERDLDRFATIVREFCLDAVCLGGLYVTREISEKLGAIDYVASSDVVSATHPLIDEETTAFVPPRAAVRAFESSIYPIPLFECSVCTTTALARVPCPIHRYSDCRAAPEEQRSEFRRIKPEDLSTNIGLTKGWDSGSCSDARGGTLR